MFAHVFLFFNAFLKIRKAKHFFAQVDIKAPPTRKKKKKKKKEEEEEEEEKKKKKEKEKKKKKKKKKKNTGCTGSNPPS